MVKMAFFEKVCYQQPFRFKEMILQLPPYVSEYLMDSYKLFAEVSHAR